MAERNVGIRFQVLEGGKVKAEMQSIGEVGAAALGGLEQQSRQAAAAVNQLRKHEVTNLTAQLTDLGVQVLSGQSFATAMIQQGPQIAAVLGDRGVKGAVMGVGTALLSLVTPTTAILAGIVALGYGASYVFDRLAGDTEDASDALERHQALVRELTERYGDARIAARQLTEEQKQLDLARARADERVQQNSFKSATDDLAGKLAPSRIRGIGEVFGGNVAFSDFAGPITEFLASVRDGKPDVDALQASVARLMNGADDPAVSKAGADILEMSDAAAKAAVRLGEASNAVLSVGNNIQFSTEQLKAFKDTLDGWRKDEQVIAGLLRQADTAGDPRQRAIDDALGRLSSSATDDLRSRTADAAAAAFDADQRRRADEKASREALNEARREQNALDREAARLYEETRTAGEAYGDTLARLDDFLARGLITQDTYSRAVAQAGKVMAQANRQALDDATDAASGYQRAVLDYVEAAQDMASATENIVVDTLSGAEDAFVSLVTTGKAEFSDLVDSILADFARLAFRQAVAPLLGSGGDFISSLLGGLSSALTGATSSGGYFAPGYVNSNAFAGPRAAGGATRAGMDYLVGENGPELFRPVNDGYILPNEVLKGGGGAKVTVNVVTLPGTTADVQQTPRADGGVDLQVQIRRMVRGEIVGALDDGSLDKGLGRRFGLRRQM